MTGSLSPSMYSTTMDLGESITIQKTVALSGKVDVFFLADNNKSMADAIDAIKSKADTILDAMSGGDPRFAAADIAFGVGSYGGDPAEGIPPDTAYKLHQTLTKNRAAVEAGLDALTATSSGDIWTVKASLPAGRSHIGVAAASNGKVYAVGGSQSGYDTSAVMEYDPATDSWRDRAPLPVRMSSIGVAAAGNGKVYAVGGSQSGYDTTAVLEYDPGTDTWTNKAPLPAGTSGIGVAAAGNGKIYAVGGSQSGSDTSAVLEYDPGTDTWTNKAPLPAGTSSIGVAAAGNGKIYAVGGSQSGSDTSAVLEYDPGTDTWTNRASFPALRSSIGVAAADNGRIYAVGGSQSSSDATTDPLPGATSRVSIATDGTQADADGLYASGAPDISGDGRYVVFQSVATNLVQGDTNGASDIFLHDRSTGVTTRISVSSDGAQANGASDQPVISGNGRYVAFGSVASNLVVGDTNGREDVFVHDLQSGETTRVSVGTDGAQGGHVSGSPALSHDGRYVAFNSHASNLVPADTNTKTDVFVRDRIAGETTRVSVASDGSEATRGNGSVAALSGLWSTIRDQAISRDGRYVTFASTATNLAPGADTGSDIYLHDRHTGETSLIQAGTSSGSSNANSSVSPDGHTVAFQYEAVHTNIRVAQVGSGGGSYGHGEVVAADGGTPDANVGGTPSLSQDGRYIAFYAAATNLVAGDTNGAEDTFVMDRLGSGTTTRVSVSSGGSEGCCGQSFHPRITPKGRYVAFSSQFSNLVSGDTNGGSDIFVRDMDVRYTSSAVLEYEPEPDAPRANFFALHQVATEGQVTATGVASGHVTGWRDDAARIVVWFGDAPSHTATVDQAQVICTLQGENVTVAAINIKAADQGIDVDGQATAVTAASGGSLSNAVTDPNAIADAILDSVDAAIDTVDLYLETSGDTSGLSISFSCTSPAGCTGVMPGESRTFDMQITADALGVYVFTTKVTDVLGAEEQDTIFVVEAYLDRDNVCDYEGAVDSGAYHDGYGCVGPVRDAMDTYCNADDFLGGSNVPATIRAYGLGIFEPPEPPCDQDIVWRPLGIDTAGALVPLGDHIIGAVNVPHYYWLDPVPEPVQTAGPLPPNGSHWETWTPQPLPGQQGMTYWCYGDNSWAVWPDLAPHCTMYEFSSLGLPTGPAGAPGFEVEVMTTWWVEGAYIIFGCGPSGLDVCEAGTYQFPWAVCDQAIVPIQQVQSVLVADEDTIADTFEWQIPDAVAQPACEGG